MCISPVHNYSYRCQQRSAAVRLQCFPYELLLSFAELIIGHQPALQLKNNWCITFLSPLLMNNLHFAMSVTVNDLPGPVVNIVHCASDELVYHLSEPSVCLPGQACDTPPGHHTLSTLALGDGNGVQHFILLED